MNKTIPNFLIPILIIFAVGLYGQDDCPDDFEFYPPGEDEPGCIEYIDCNDNGAFDVGEPCYDDGDGGDHPGGGPPQAGDECDLCDHVYSGEEDHHGHCPAPTCDVVLDTDEDWEEHCNDDPDHCPEPPDGDDGYEEYGEHTVGNCIAFAEGRGSYWIGDEEFAVWDDPNVDCNYLFDQIGYQPPAYMCSWTWDDGNTCGYTSEDPDDSHQHCGFTFSDGNICGWAPWENNTFHEHCDQVFPDGNPCGASFDNEGDMDAHQDDHADDGGGWYCQICDEHFATEADMDQHAADMGHTDDWYCQICDEHFATEADMDQHAADMGHTDEGCDPDGDYPTDPPGAGNGCIDYADCNGNNVYDLSEPCYDND